jgi:hypothetical protein
MSASLPLSASRGRSTALDNLLTTPTHMT